MLIILVFFVLALRLRYGLSAFTPVHVNDIHGTIDNLINLKILKTDLENRLLSIATVFVFDLSIYFCVT